MLEEIRRAFPNRPPGVIYAFGDIIYNPGGHFLPPAIVAHEAEHGYRQHNGYGPEKWWRKYIDDAAFRYQEELKAHAAEYRAQAGGDRNRNACLKIATVARLLAPFYEYGSQQPTMREALRDLTREIG